MEVLANTLRHKKEIKYIESGEKRIQLSFTDVMIVYVENIKNSTKNLLELRNDYIKVAGHTVNVQRSIPSYIPAVNSGIWNWKHIIIYISTQRKNYLIINLKYTISIVAKQKYSDEINKLTKWRNIPC